MLQILSEDEEVLLFEIYGLTRRDFSVAINQYFSFSPFQTINSGAAALEVSKVEQNATDALRVAIDKINDSPAEVTRVRAILNEYSCTALDMSTIDKDGYKMNPVTNIKNLKLKLYPYTGIYDIKDFGGNNKLCLG